MSPSDQLLASLDRYVARELQRRLAWGLLRWGAVVLAAWGLLVALEGALWLGPAARLTALVAWGLLAVGLLVAWVGLPAWRAGRAPLEMRRREASRQVGAALPAVADALLNFLQLRAHTPPPGSLVAADLDTRAAALVTQPYPRLVRWAALRRPALVLLGLVLLGALAVAVWPEQLGGGQQRLLSPARAYAPPPPYSLSYLQLTNPVVQGEAFALEVVAQGRAVPERLEFYTDGAAVGLPLRVLGGGRFALQLPAPERDFTFTLGGEATRSAPVAVQVLQRPQLRELTLELRYPAHTSLKAERLAPFVGDATVPEGTVAVWRLRASGPPAQATWHSGAEAAPFGSAGASLELRRQVRRATTYRIRLRAASGLYSPDSQAYTLQVIADRPPSVRLISPADQALLPPVGILPLEGEATDDYGLSAAWLLYRPLGASDSAIRRKELTISRERSVRVAADIDWLALGLAEGATWELALEVADNDGVNGAKRARTAWQRLRNGSRLEALAEAEAQADTAADALTAATARAEAIRRELEQLRRQALEGKPIDFDTKRRLAALEREQQQVRQQIEQATEQLSSLAERAQQQQTASPTQQDQLARLQEQLKALTTPDELEQLLKSLQEQRRTDSRSLFKAMEQLERTGRFQQQDLSRLKDLVQRWREQQRREALAQRAEALQQRQQALENLTREQKSPDELSQLAQQQQQLAQKAEQLARDLKRQSEVQPPMPDSARPNPARPDSARTQPEHDPNAGADSSASPEQLGERARQNMQRAADELQRQRPRQARPRQQQAQDQLEQLAQQLRTEQQDDALEQATENYEDLRALTENLLKLSFDQEAVQEQLQRLRANDPSLKQKSAAQVRLRADMQQVEDSLNALAGRVPQIKQEVLDRTRGVTVNLDDAIRALDERQLSQTGVYQQEARTNMNALTNLLVDALSQLQSQLRAAQNRRGRPQPGSPSSLRQLAEQQQQLGDELSQQQGEAAQAERLRQLAERQAELRQQLKDLYDRLRQQGEKGMGSLDKVGQDMELNEADLRAAQITRQTLERQQQILSRMLDYDKALREREYDEQRAARAAGTAGPRVTGSTPDQRPERRGQDVLQRRPLSYSPSLQQLIDRYFQALPPR